MYSQNMQDHGKEQPDEVAALDIPGSWTVSSGDHQPSERPTPVRRAGAHSGCLTMPYSQSSGRAGVGLVALGKEVHQDSPSGGFPNYGARILMLGSQDEIETKRKMNVFCWWIQELLGVLITCVFEWAPAASVHARACFWRDGHPRLSSES